MSGTMTDALVFFLATLSTYYAKLLYPYALSQWATHVEKYIHMMMMMMIMMMIMKAFV